MQNLSIINMKNLYILLLFGLILVGPAVAAQQGQNQPTGKPVEFVDIDDYEGAVPYFGNFLVELGKVPGAKGYIIVYRSERDLPGISLRYALRAKNYLVWSGRHDPDQLVALDGGVASYLKVELWVVPSGATPPDPTLNDKYRYERVNRDFLREFDEYIYHLPRDASDCGWCSYDDKSSRLDGFAARLKEEPKSRAYIIAYAQSYEDRGMMNSSGATLNRDQYYVLQDPPGTAERILRSEKDYLLRKHGIDPSRIMTINGGYRADRTVELWIAPPHTPAPRPIPTVYPMRRRRG
jgi:hypothetical protein